MMLLEGGRVADSEGSSMQQVYQAGRNGPGLGEFSGRAERSPADQQQQTREPSDRAPQDEVGSRGGQEASVMIAAGWASAKT